MLNYRDIDISAYKIKIEKLSDDDGGGYLATVPRLPGCMSDGETREEAIKNIEDAIKAWIGTARELGRNIPMPEPYKSEYDYSGKLTLRIPKSLHKALAEQSEEEGCSINQLILTYISMGLGKEYGKNDIYISLETKTSPFENIMRKHWEQIGLESYRKNIPINFNRLEPYI